MRANNRKKSRSSRRPLGLCLIGGLATATVALLGNRVAKYLMRRLELRIVAELRGRNDTLGKPPKKVSMRIARLVAAYEPPTLSSLGYGRTTLDTDPITDDGFPPPVPPWGPHDVRRSA